MKKAITWFLVGVILGNLLLVYANTDSPENNRGRELLTPKSSMGFEIQGPLNWSPRPVLTEIPSELVTQLQQLNPKIPEDTVHIGTLVFEKKGIMYSLFVDKDTDNVWYAQWDKNSNRLLNVGTVRFKLLENTTRRESKYVGWAFGNRVKLVETFHTEKLQATDPGILSSVYIITAWQSYEWYLENPITGEDSLTTKTVAKGKFYVDYGNRILGVDDLSYDYQVLGVIKCSFSSHTSGVGTVSAGVYADASYMFWDLLSPVATHWDAHPRVFVDAWTNVDGDSWGNKWIGGPWC
ncbi:hypothetical protein [Thermococcus camini]|uniref:Uncharacterized protein n=1 Tax=Thermococcus camini TaxID=2016373 RepID=A0A7G2D7X0_9EURY|nr:hypothetical protein [Thermococcus camini]CAD5244555.1 conserved protein of unknown function [Thermococcus camini]